MIAIAVVQKHAWQRPCIYHDPIPETSTWVTANYEERMSLLISKRVNYCANYSTVFDPMNISTKSNQITVSELVDLRNMSSTVE